MDLNALLGMLASMRGIGVEEASFTTDGVLQHVRFLPQPATPLVAAPPPVIEGAERMTQAELKAATELAERERLLFRSS